MFELDPFYTACVTGHRPTKIGGYDPNHPLRQKVRSELRVKLHLALAHGYRTFVSGMALGVDQDFAETVLEFRAAQVVEGIRLVAALPCKGQERMWPERSQLHYRGLLALADHVELVDPGEYSAWKMMRRNVWMVDHAGLVIAVWDGTDGGTANCVRYAERQGRVIWRVNPKEL